MDQRLRFVTEWRESGESMTELCAHYDISRETGYKWVARFEEGGVAALADRSRRPARCPGQTPDRVVAAVLEARRRHPTWGPKKLLSRGWPLAVRPGLSTVSLILNRHGLVSARRRRPRPLRSGPPAAAIDRPNALWTIDFKGQFRTGDGTWCYPLTIVDHWSRYLLACRSLPSVRTDGSRAAVERVFREYGLPERIRSDNGAPFASALAVGRLSLLAVWWIRLGIVPERIQPGCPGQNGRHERLHRTLKRETARPPAATGTAQQRRFQRFRTEYNDERPHEALGQRPPTELYVPSPRPYPRVLPPLEYAAHMLVRRVAPCGSFKWHGRWVPISHTLIGQDLGFAEVDDGRWAVHFASVGLGYFDERTWTIQPLAAITTGALAGCAGSRPAVKED
jgi:transposase InsO family protein